MKPTTEKEKVLDYFKHSGKRIAVVDKLFTELSQLGVDYTIGLRPNNYAEVTEELKLDNPELYISDKKLLKKVVSLVRKYEKILNKTCEDCGRKINFGIGGSKPFCAKCFHPRRMRWNYENISSLGYSALTFDPYSNTDKREFFYWNEFSHAEFVCNNHEPNFYPIEFPNEINFYYKKERDLIPTHEPDWPHIQTNTRVSNWHEGFYTLIKYIPDELLSENDRNIKRQLTENLTGCRICGYRSLIEAYGCIVCRRPFHTVLTERMKKRYTNVDDVNKWLQLNYKEDSRSRYKYPKCEKEFDKSKNFIPLFTPEELKARLKR